MARLEIRHSVGNVLAHSYQVAQAELRRHPRLFARGQRLFGGPIALTRGRASLSTVFRSPRGISSMIIRNGFSYCAIEASARSAAVLPTLVHTPSRRTMLYGPSSVLAIHYDRTFVVTHSLLHHIRFFEKCILDTFVLVAEHLAGD